MKENTEEAMSFPEFARVCFPSFSGVWFHENYYRVLGGFAHGSIKRLIVTLPPQHGKSVGASVLLPAYILGLNPDAKVTISSYNATLASRLNRRVQRIIDSAAYEAIFPETTIKRQGGKANGSYERSSTRAEVIGHGGEIASTGREGTLTGNQVDIIILDDLYKDAMEANSPTVRENCWEWYTSVVKTRLHNDAQELIVFTRWHEEDLIGRIMQLEQVVPLVSMENIGPEPEDGWLHLHYEAIKDSPPSAIDPRQKGEPLWPLRHGIKRLEAIRNLDPLRFDALYQGRPSSKEGLLYGENFRTWEHLPSEVIKMGNYTDTADTGEDHLCSVCYVVTPDRTIYVTDVVYSQAKMEVTEGLVAEMVNRAGVLSVLVESNNGGRGFARAVERLCPLARVEWFHQSANKEARILTNSATLLHRIRMPHDWPQRWPTFYHHLTTYKRIFASNRWHDAPDVLTGIIEHEITSPATSKRIRGILFSK